MIPANYAVRLVRLHVNECPKVSGSFDVLRSSTAQSMKFVTILVILSLRVSELRESARHDGSIAVFIALIISSFQQGARSFSV